ncbi:MAG: tRNA (adenosine(37)-N6)-threonylcarbamoyltransferase complex dimerization subunit type 1 TsaB [Kiritimatiellae bacterium]|nr:tRNA (adenosine(37)-N6)-threonylcarbamoyltransferase complex dimerization subunit type 1 TsaB [Kiritimatiellia bacterium]MCO5061502.1 tRNA (adenosine(37)-N6)-threonylcarbamoyltransferase complex dimerization subunit type 1 TsaB [Kiritimatiellia bacterium]MCO6401508.1 tRNA (adenosine(37)-N6)-threonylcarbamoyltransferase complex dimerization subunit type 1 TsaB [Verrucomicrobiota bacterium]
MILAFEQSSRRGSIALCRASETLAHREWDDPLARHTRMGPALQELLKESNLQWDALTAIAVGRGPGSFSGLRAAITTARVLAAPSAIPVMALSSGAALAHDWFSRQPTNPAPLVVAGDARRGAIWYAIFCPNTPGMRPSTDWTLAPATEFSARLPANATLATSDRARLLAALGDAASTLEPIEEVFPAATALAHLAQMRFDASLPSEPPEPLYLHAATLA